MLPPPWLSTGSVLGGHASVVPLVVAGVILSGLGFLLSGSLARWARRRRARGFLARYHPEVLTTPRTRKVLLVSPTTYLPDGRLFKDRRVQSPGLAPMLVAAITPPHWEVEVCWEIAETLGLETDAEVVAIGNMGHSLWRARDLAAEFRARGKHVVIAGTMSSMIPEWVQDHCDTVLVGDVEETWPRFLADFERGEPLHRYDPPRLHPLEGLPVPRYDLMLERDTLAPLFPVQIARGCPYRCRFCSIHALSGGTYTPRPVDEVVRDVRAAMEFGARHFFFLDDNLAGDRAYAARLFEAVEPLGIRWVSQSTLDILADGLLEKAIASGCFTLCFGMESLQQESLNSVKKGFCRTDRYEEVTRRIRDAGMLQTAEFIIGMDHDTPETLEVLADFIEEQAIPLVRCYIYAPIPGTPVWEEYRDAGRLVSEEHDQIGGARVGFVPVHFTPEELLDSYWALMDRLFTWRSILRRVFAHPVPSWHDALAAVALNLHYRRLVGRREVPGLS